MFAKGQIVLDRTTPAAVIPATALRDEAGQMYVFTIEDGKIAKRPVKVGVTNAQEGLVEVKSGLETGLQVVSARVAGLKAGAPAIFKPAVAKPSQSGLRRRLDTSCGAPRSINTRSPTMSWWRVRSGSFRTRLRVEPMPTHDTVVLQDSCTRAPPEAVENDLKAGEEVATP